MVDGPVLNSDNPNEEGVMKIDVTPQSPLIAQQPREPINKARKKSAKAPRFIILAIIAIIVIAVIAVVLSIIPMHHLYTTTTAPTTTISSINASTMTKCGVIDAPGSYYLTKGINTSIASGTCISINSSNVALVCNGNKITGSGPYVGVPPFTYGIEVENRSNVTIEGCYISDFSYGIYLKGDSLISIYNSNVSHNYMNNVYMNKTSTSRISNSYLSYSAGTKGSIYITGNSTGNMLANNTLLFNRYYGVYIQSSGNTYLHNYINATPYSFYCSGANGFVNSSKGSSNICFNNTGCGFLTCKGINIPANLSQIYLQNDIRSCGSITKPGVYNIESNLSMNRYVNVSNPMLIQYEIPCINIASSNVTLNCNSKIIGNATFAGITAKNVYNVAIENCNVKRSSFGLLLNNVTKAVISNTIVSGSTVAFALQNSSIDTINNLDANGNTYGIYLQGSDANLFNNFNISYNNVGIYLSSSIGNSFNNGLARNNSKLDVYASPDSLNATYNLMQNTACTYTNAMWATCTEHVSPNLAYKPIIACTTITKPGNYSMLNNVQGAPSGCITISTDNIKLNCNNYTISASNLGYGNGFYIIKSSNVTLLNCNLLNFNASVRAANSDLIKLNNIRSDNSNYGLALSNVSNSSMQSIEVQKSTSAGIYLNKSINNIISNSNVTGSNIAVYIINSTYNHILSNIAYANNVGMLISGNSKNNTINNNTMEQSSYFDYECNGNSGVNDEYATMNYGSKKMGCKWLAALPIASPDVSCIGINSPSSIVMTSDGIYPYGNRCFGIYANDTTINCNGHTVISTSGGTFASFYNSSNGKVEDCILKGFNSPIIAKNSSVQIINDTIVASPTSSTGVNITESRGSAVIDNNVSAYIGISISNSQNGKISGNVAGSGAYAYVLSNSTGFTISGNLALSSATIGFLANRSVFNTFENNNFQSIGGIVCMQSASGAYNNTDEGGNICTTNQNCKWVSSAQCK